MVPLREKEKKKGQGFPTHGIGYKNSQQGFSELESVNFEFK